MKAKIVQVQKQTLPLYDSKTQKDELTLVVVTTVEFYKDDGTLYHTQSYAQRPEEIDPENPKAYFDRQAQAMQADVDGQAANAVLQEKSNLADQIIQKLQSSAG